MIRQQTFSAVTDFLLEVKPEMLMQLRYYRPRPILKSL